MNRFRLIIILTFLSQLLFSQSTTEKKTEVKLYYFLANLTTLPDSIFQIDNLVEINLGANPRLNFSNVLTDLSKIKTLKKLILSDNNISTLPSEICLLTNLSDLDLHNNSITKLPVCFSVLKNVESLNLSHNNICDSFDLSIISKIDSLKILDLSNNNLTIVPNVISDLNKIEQLYLHQNRISEIPNYIMNLDNLWNLAVGDSISVIPDFLFEVKHKLIIDLTNNDISLKNERLRITPLFTKNIGILFNEK